MPGIGTRFGTRGLSIGPHRGRSTTTAEFSAPTRSASQWPTRPPNAGSAPCAESFLTAPSSGTNTSSNTSSPTTSTTPTPNGPTARSINDPQRRPNRPTPTDNSSFESSERHAARTRQRIPKCRLTSHDTVSGTHRTTRDPSVVLVPGVRHVHPRGRASRAQHERERRPRAVSLSPGCHLRRQGQPSQDVSRRTRSLSGLHPRRRKRHEQICESGLNGYSGI